jgi:hypothetical protein
VDTPELSAYESRLTPRAVKDIKDLHPRVPHVSRFEAVKKPSTKLIDRVKKQGKLGT